MRFPDFLIIGGMKCGSTTVYRDLMTNPDVYFPLDKEPGNLGSDAVLAPQGRAGYAALFAQARPDQRCGEASTAYTKRPTIEGAAGRALQLCGPTLRLVYIVREPVARIASHHHHDLTEGRMPPDLGEAIRSHPELLDFSRYAMQAQPWIDAFGPDAVRVVRFEDYTRDRRRWVESLSAFIGVQPRPDLIDPEAVFNKSEAKPVMSGPFAAIASTTLYRRVVRPMLSSAVKDRLRSALLPKSQHARQAPPGAVAERVYEALADDLERLRTIMGLDRPVWTPRDAQAG